MLRFFFLQEMFWLNDHFLNPATNSLTIICQLRICKEIEDLDGKSTFKEDTWVSSDFLPVHVMILETIRKLHTYQQYILQRSVLLRGKQEKRKRIRKEGEEYPGC